MGQSVRQTARRAALETQAKRRRERAEAGRRCSALGIDVAVALTERDAAIERFERAAGAAFLKLTRDEGLALPEACEWADNLPTAEAKRLLRLIVPTSGSVYMSGGSVPPGPEEIDLEEPECWKYESGEDLLPEDWTKQLGGEFEKDYWYELLSFVAEERGVYDVFPPPSQTFAAFEFTPYKDVRVVILGQDPYPNAGEAQGLAFSVPADIPVPPSLQNIHKELEADLEVPTPDHGNLEGWAEQGVLLLNTALTVRAGSKEDRKAHRNWRWEGQGWGTFTDAVIRAINANPEPVVFILWGKDARKKKSLIDNPRHKLIESVHPSPLSAYRGFVRSKPFSRTNEYLRSAGRGEIDWFKFESSR